MLGIVIMNELELQRIRCLNIIKNLRLCTVQYNIYELFEIRIEIIERRDDINNNQLVIN